MRASLVIAGDLVHAYSLQAVVKSILVVSTAFPASVCGLKDDIRDVLRPVERLKKLLRRLQKRGGRRSAHASPLVRLLALHCFHHVEPDQACFDTHLRSVFHRRHCWLAFPACRRISLRAGSAPVLDWNPPLRRPGVGGRLLRWLKLNEFAVKRW